MPFNSLRRVAAIATAGAFSSFVGYQYMMKPTTKSHKSLDRAMLDNDADAASELTRAILNNDADAASTLTRNHPELLNQTYEFVTGAVLGGCDGATGTELDHALYRDSLDVAQVLVENGSRVEKTMLYGPDSIMGAPIHIAAKYGHTGLIKAIYSQKPSLIDAVDSEGNTALCYAISPRRLNDEFSPAKVEVRSNLPTIMLLVGLGVNPRHKNHAGQTVYSVLEENGLGGIALMLQTGEQLSAFKAKLRA